MRMCGQLELAIYGSAAVPVIGSPCSAFPSKGGRWWFHKRLNAVFINHAGREGGGGPEVPYSNMYTLWKCEGLIKLVLSGFTNLIILWSPVICIWVSRRDFASVAKKPLLT